jgi:hypothetical protein
MVVTNMVSTQVSNQWYLRQNEFDLLVANGLQNKTHWWVKNLTTGQFINYGQWIPGNQAFNATMELEPGEYMGATGDYKLTTPDGRHCSQVFYFYVDESGAHVCKKNELPSQGGSGVSGTQTSVTGWGNGNGAGWGPVTVNTQTSSAPASKVEYFIIPNYKACMQDMAVRPGFEGCDDCDPIDLMGSMDCTNCRHALDVYVKKA